ncbi:MAG: MFS transporter [Ardenticatenaceae bacterium]|nr:MFS transporter [Ardenticatenaceae bacterium]
MTTVQASFLKERSYVAVALTHFCVDVLNSSRNLLMALLAINLGLTNAQLGINLLLYNIGSSLSQPVFGWLADRIGSRLLVVGGMGWMILFFALAATLPEWPALIAVTVAGLGSGAFHPTGTKVASEASKEFTGRATAVFFMSGQLGLFAGPVLAGFLLEGYGRPGYLVLPVIALTAFVGGWQWLSHQHTHKADAARAAVAAPPFDLSAKFLRGAGLLFLIILSYSSVGIAAMTFAPKLFTEMGFEASYVGWLAGLFMLGSAGGGVIGGALADRFSGRWVIFGSLMAAILPIYFYIPVAGIGRFLLLFAAGFASGMPHSILVLRVQSLFPGRRALASGLALGTMFFSGSVGSYVMGLIADNVGLAVTLQGTAVLPLIAGLLALLLPKREQS